MHEGDRAESHGVSRGTGAESDQGTIAGIRAEGAQPANGDAPFGWRRGPQA